jgi:spoIIIJ-associated protein
MTEVETTGHEAHEAPTHEDLDEAVNGTAPAEGDGEGDLEERLVAEGEIAGDYLEELLDLLDFDGDIDLDVEGSRAIVSIDGSDDLGKLVGRKGEVLDALQELTRLAVHQKTGVRSRLAPPPPRGVGRAGRQGCQAGAGKWRTRGTRTDDTL